MANIIWSITESEIRNILPNSIFSVGSSMGSALIDWGNRIVRDLHVELNMRTHLKHEGSSLVFTTADEYIALPSDFLKISRRFTKVRVSDKEIPIIGLDKLYTYDIDHNDTTTNTYPDYVAIESGNMFPYPLFTGTAILENYYKAPTVMATDADSPDLPDDIVVQDLLISGVLYRAARVLQDWDMYKVFREDFETHLSLYKDHINLANDLTDNEMLYF